MQLCNPVFRSSLISMLEKKIAAGKPKLKGVDKEFDIDEMKKELAELKNWKQYSKQEKKEISKRYAEGQSFQDGYAWAYEKKEKIQAVPGNASKKIKEGFKGMFDEK